MLEDLRFRLRALFHRRPVEDGLDDELRFHVEREVEKNLARGMSPPEARRQARLAFGQIDVIKDDCRLACLSGWPCSSPGTRLGVCSIGMTS